MEVSAGQCRCTGQSTALSKPAKHPFGPKVANCIHFAFITSRSLVLKQDVPGLYNAKCKKGKLSPEEFTVDVSGCNTAAQHQFLNGL